MCIFSLHLVPFPEIISLWQKTFFLVFFSGRAELTDQSLCFCQDSLVTRDRQSKYAGKVKNLLAHRTISQKAEGPYSDSIQTKKLLKNHKTGKYEYLLDIDDV